MHYETREVRSQVVPDVTGKTLLTAIREQAGLANLWLHTDGAKAYDMADPFVQEHIYVDHSAGQ